MIPSVGDAQGGASAAIILELPASARAMALGGASTSLDGDAAVFYNPAQLGALRDASATLSAQRYIFSSTLGALSAATRLGPGTAAIGVQALEYGSEDEIVPDEDFGGERGRLTGAKVDAGDLVVTLGYGIAAGRLRAGVAAKVVRQRIADEAGSAPGFDAGMAVSLWRGATLAAAVQNLGGSLETGTTSSPLPRVVRVGGSMPYALTSSFSLMATADVVIPRAATVVSGGGIEARWQGTPGLSLVGRVGGQIVGGDDDGAPLTAGAAIAGRHLAVDYAFRAFDVVGGAMHRLGVRWWR
jgi:hypothetical protein